jgi:hypothetical protein
MGHGLATHHEAAVLGELLEQYGPGHARVRIAGDTFDARVVRKKPMWVLLTRLSGVKARRP